MSDETTTTKPERVRFTRIVGEEHSVTGMVMLKRIGKIRLGVKKQSAQSGNEYPDETQHFVCPPEVEAVYGPNPMQLDGMFASNDPEQVYVEKLVLYGKTTGVKCHGNGQVAEFRNEKGDWQPRSCPCEMLKTKENPKGQCGPQGSLMVMLPKVSMWGCYQITTRSIYARRGILESLRQMQENLKGRIAHIPIKLYRVAQAMTHEGKARTHYILSFVPDLTLPQILDLRKESDLLVIPEHYQIEAPKDENPEDDPVDMVVNDDEGIDAEDLANMDDQQLEDAQARLQARRQASQHGTAAPSTGTPAGTGAGDPVPPGSAPAESPAAAAPSSAVSAPSDLVTFYTDRFNEAKTLPDLAAISNAVEGDQALTSEQRMTLRALYGRRKRAVADQIPASRKGGRR